MLEKQNKFNLNNWSHVAKLVIIGILSIFMIIVFYYIRIQLWKSLKNTYTQNQMRKGQNATKDQPFIIYTKDRNNQLVKEELQEV